MRKRIGYLLAPLLLGGGLLGVTHSETSAFLIYNPSASAPQGFYKIARKDHFIRGDFVAAQLPPPAIVLNNERRYLPENTPILKSVYGVPGDEICIHVGAVFVNETPIVMIEKEDSIGRQMHVREGCFLLQQGQYFLLSTRIKNSFDSRYFGPVGEYNILGVATPLFIFSEEN